MARGPKVHVDHFEWLQLVEVSGPFLSRPVLSEVLPQGMAADDREVRVQLQQAHEEWFTGQRDRAIHHLWIAFVLREALGFRDEDLVDDPQALSGLAVAVPVHGETLRADLAVLGPEPDGGGPRPARLLVQRLPADTDLEKRPSGARWAADHLTRMVELLKGSKDQDLSLGLVTNGDRWTLVSAPREGTTTFVTWSANLWFQEKDTLRAFREFLGADRIFGDPAETLERLIERSAKDQNELTDQLGLQVREAIELLVQAIDDADRADRGGRLLAGVSDQALYEAAVTVMMRLVFVFYAEDRGLLPLARSPLYRDHYALTPLAAELRDQETRHGQGVLERRSSAWPRMLATFRAIHGGVHHQDMQLIAHGGDMFDPDRFPFLEGREAGTRWCDGEGVPLGITDRMALLLLEALQFLRVSVPGGRSETRRLSFRELGVEEIGHVYEGLLDHTVVRAQGAVLSLKGRAGEEPEVPLEELQSRYKPTDFSKLVSFVREGTGRTKQAIEKDLPPNHAIEDEEPWRIACDNDAELWRSIEPFAGLVREDRTGRPVVIRPGSAYVTAGSDRRSTGTHYTPRSLTEPIVRTTLEPVVYEGPAEGKPKEEWVLKSPRELLELKVCDPACGSGAFLVQACRYLAGLLVESWQVLEDQNPGRVLISPEGDLSEGLPEERPLPKDGDERIAIAKRAVAERCLYGVDKNHLAVEMARLSLWLETLQEGKPFQFVDHALKCGDSLVGLTKDQIAAFHWKADKSPTKDFFEEQLKADIGTSLGWRDSLHELGEWDYERKKEAWWKAESALDDARLIGDLAVAAFFGADKDKAREELRGQYRSKVEAWRGNAANRRDLEAVVEELRGGEKPVPPMHWEIEFPEVFERENPGFDAMVGNPPYAGHVTLSAATRGEYTKYLRSANPGSGGKCDLIAFFFRQSFRHLRKLGCLGFVATSTVRQGDTRSSGLRMICRGGGVIYEAHRRFRWPGRASVEVALVFIQSERRNLKAKLDGELAPLVTAYLFDRGGSEDPKVLLDSCGKTFQGVVTRAKGFLFDDSKIQCEPVSEATRLLNCDPGNAKVIRPFLGGGDFLDSPDVKPSRWVIDFGNMPEPEARRWREAYAICEKRVKVERARSTAKTSKGLVDWWKFGHRAEAMYRAILGHELVLACAQTSKYKVFALVSTDIVLGQTLVVTSLSGFSALGVLQSRIHEIWATFFSSTLEDRPRYMPTDAFETFPFPFDWQANPALESTGRAYYEFRANLMVRNNEGLTKTYNRFHSSNNHEPDIVKLRELHAAMDRAVLDAYGWADISTDCEFLLDYEIDEETWGNKKKPYRYRWPDEVHDEVLARLLDLNQKRYQEEVAQGLHQTGSKKKASSKRKARGASRDVGLFDA